MTCRFDASCAGKVLLLSLSLIFLTSSNIVQATQHQPWEQKHRQLQRQRDIVFSQLEKAYVVLVVRVQDENPVRLTRLSLNPPKARTTGYGLLPLIQENDSLSPTMVPRQTFYSLKWLEERLHEELQNANKLNTQVRGPAEIESLVIRFEESLKQLWNLEDNLSYHAKWQKAIVQYPAYYRNKNELVALAREINLVTINDAPTEQIVELRQQLVERVSTFKPTSRLRLLIAEGGEMVLPVTVCTDIEDSDFLQAFQEGVQESFSRSPAARANRFAVDLKWRFITADILYPGGAPDRGAKIDMTTHRALFPDCPLVLTTGASSLNALTGNRIFLGTDPVSRRTLAHEFGHLLGFEDAYMRGYNGEPGDTYGVVIVEWTGLTADLMGDSERGQVSNEMIATLINTYGGLAVE